MAEDEMVGWHHRLNGQGFGSTLGVGDGQGGLACCDSWAHKQLDKIRPFSDPNHEFVWLSKGTFSSVQFSSLAQSCPTLCDPMDYSTPGLRVHHQLLELIQTHVH